MTVQSHSETLSTLYSEPLKFFIDKSETQSSNFSTLPIQRKDRNVKAIYSNSMRILCLFIELLIYLELKEAVDLDFQTHMVLSTGQEKHKVFKIVLE